MIDPLFIYLSSAFIALYFLLSGIHKFMNLDRFCATLNDYELLPDRLAKPVARLLALLELVIGGVFVLLSVQVFAVGSMSWPSYAAAWLLLLYAVAMAINIYRGRTNIDCGCSFQARKTPLSYGHLLRNMALACLSLVPLFPASERDLTHVDVMHILLGLVVVAMVYLSTEALLANRLNSQQGAI